MEPNPVPKPFALMSFSILFTFFIQRTKWVLKVIITSRFSGRLEDVLKESWKTRNFYVEGVFSTSLRPTTLREKCSNTELFLVLIFLYSD